MEFILFGSGINRLLFLKTDISAAVFLSAEKEFFSMSFMIVLLYNLKKKIVKKFNHLNITKNIIDKDKEKCKIGLSIKELEGTSKEYGYEEYISLKQ